MVSPDYLGARRILSIVAEYAVFGSDQAGGGELRIVTGDDSSLTPDESEIETELLQGGGR